MTVRYDIESDGRAARLATIEARRKKIHPVVYFIDREIFDKGYVIPKVMASAGVGPKALGQWRSGRSPTLANVTAVLGVLGYRLTVERIADIKDK